MIKIKTLSVAALAAVSLLAGSSAQANFLVAESGSGRAEIYGSAGNYLGTFAAGFITPMGVAEGGGYVFVSDLTGSYVYKYSMGGSPLGIVNQGAVGGGHMPAGIAYANGRINGTAYGISYVTSSAPDAGVEDGSPSTPSSYLYYATPAGPHGMTSAAPNGFPGLYYTTSAGDGSGTLGYWEPGVSAIDGIISFAAGSNPRGVVADSSGDLFIALSGAGKIVKRDGAGVLTDWLTGLNSPVGLAVDGGNLYVSSYSGKTITGYRLTDVSQVSQFSTLSNPQYFAITRIAARPVANDASFVRPAGLTLKIRVTDLLANASDANGYPLTLLSVGPSTNGVAVTTDESFMSYANPSAVADRFPYTVSNGQGGSATANVFINITTNSIGRVQGITVTNGAVALKFAGIQNYRYDVERATDVTFKQNRTVLLTTNAPASGLFSITDTDPPAPMAYYRLRYNP